ncbi:hypothetical protein, partial [Sandarakinorhabdus sp.]|uniref:hypothetical protein n=1 Tax=Sandarakinorhabdus sp. TaxID=1916663 RepID=UPI00286D6D37
LIDIVGWQHRGCGGAQLGPGLVAALALLARPFAPAEAVVIKPSTVVNGFATAMMQLVRGARALLLHAPLPVYLGSIARKGMTGRLWVRDLLTKQLKEGQHRFGFSGDDYLGQTDLQVAAMGWLAQQALFAGMAARFEGRVACIDSESLMANPLPAMTGLARLFGLALDVPAIVAGPAFTRHSKSGTAFSAEDRLAVQALEAAHADEIAKVTAWTLAVAQASGVPMDLPRPLIA